MLLELKPETEQLVQDAIRRGHFHSVDELIVQSLYAWREKHQISPSSERSAEHRRPEGKKSLAQLFAESPFKGLSMNFERFPDGLPPVDL